MCGAGAHAAAVKLDITSMCILCNGKSRGCYSFGGAAAGGFAGAAAGGFAGAASGALAAFGNGTGLWDSESR